MIDNANTPPAPERAGAAPTFRPSVLLAEDDAAFSRVMTGRLKDIGAQVSTCFDATHALFIMAREGPPDLLIIDIRMPAGNGLAVCEMMRDDARLKDVPIIVISGQADDQMAARAVSMQAHFIRKHADMWPELRELCCQILGIASAPA